MKKVLLILLCFMLMATLALAVNAASVTYTNYDLSVPYDTTEFSGAMRRVYNTGGWFTNARGVTYISCSNDKSGYASCTVTDLNGTISASDGTTKDAYGWVSSGTATGTQDYAKRMNHYGYRYITGNMNTAEYFVCNIYIGNE